MYHRSSFTDPIKCDGIGRNMTFGRTVYSMSVLFAAHARRCIIGHSPLLYRRLTIEFKHTRSARRDLKKIIIIVEKPLSTAFCISIQKLFRAPAPLARCSIRTYHAIGQFNSTVNANPNEFARCTMYVNIHAPAQSVWSHFTVCCFK